MLATKQPSSALKSPHSTRVAGELSSSLVRDLAALRTSSPSKFAAPQPRDSARRLAVENSPNGGSSSSRMVTTFTASSSGASGALAPSNKSRPMPVTSASRKKTLSASSSGASSSAANVTPKKQLSIHVSSNTSAASQLLASPTSSTDAFGVPPSPITSASPSARRIRIAMHSPSAASASSSASSSPSPAKRFLPPETPKKMLFSPQYQRAEEERIRREKAARRAAAPVTASPRTNKTRTQPIQPSSTITTLPTTYSYTAPAPSTAQAPPADEDEFDPFVFIKNLPPLSSLPPHRIPPLPVKSVSHRITLALDLDETLVHCSITPIAKPNFTFSVHFNNADYTVYVKTRPGMLHFLQQVARWYEVVIFTASQQVYADKLLDIIDPQRALIQHRVFRDSCVQVEGNYLKDLTVLGRPMDACMLVDNSIQAFGFQLENGIPIESWFDREDDAELSSLLQLLERMKDVRDVRPVIAETYRLRDMIERCQG